MGLAAGPQAGHALAAAVLSLTISTVAAAELPVAVELTFSAPEGQPDLVAVDVIGLPAAPLSELAYRSLSRRQWAEILCVSALADPQADPDSLPCLLGAWYAAKERVHFRPRFPPAPGMTLLARFDGAAFDRIAGRPTGVSETPSRKRRWSIPELTRRPTTMVAGVFPSSERLAANLLRLYVEFSAPMSARDVLPRVRLIDVELEAAIGSAFVEVPGGLWDPQRTRLTLLVHPGRIKRGVGPRMALGPVLEEGRSYRLEVDAEARDADGLPLVSGFTRTFEVGPPDHVSPDPERWVVDSPRTPDTSLTVELAESADHALLARLLTVVDDAGEPVEGRSWVGPEEREWSFEPAEPWAPGRYELVVPAVLEDPSGNRPGRRFEEPGGEEAGPGEPPIRLSFEVPPPS